ncbi:MAG: hypothetical protein J3Q66DRAFT_322291 [Benniella sp.]|nr:MAG: hypothetical protein J3Q66DRAFT_322291 [Benniella sp.]
MRIVFSISWARVVCRPCPFLAALEEETRVTRHIIMRIDTLDGEWGISDRGSGPLYHFSFVAIEEEGNSHLGDAFDLDGLMHGR